MLVQDPLPLPVWNPSIGKDRNRRARATICAIASRVQCSKGRHSVHGMAMSVRVVRRVGGQSLLSFKHFDLFSTPRQRRIRQLEPLSVATMPTHERAILVVEDDPAISDLIRRMLEREGYLVEVASNAPTALRRVEAGGVGLVLLDVGLPEMNGLELCGHLRATEGETHLPIIMVTGRVSHDDRHAGFLAGANDYVTKPFTHQELVDRVRVWVRTREYLEISRQSPQGEPTGENEALLAVALSTSSDLTRLLMLLLSLLEQWDARGDSPEDFGRLRHEFQDAAAVLAARINTLTRRAHFSASSGGP